MKIRVDSFPHYAPLSTEFLTLPAPTNADSYHFFPGQSLPLPRDTSKRCRVRALTGLLFRSHATVTVSGQGPGRITDAVVRPWSVHTSAVLTVGWVLTLVYICGTHWFTHSSGPLQSLDKHSIRCRRELRLTCYHCHYTVLLVGVWSPGMVTVAVEGPISVDALTISAHGLVVTFVDI